jgi:hypothetical protein
VPEWLQAGPADGEKAEVSEEVPEEDLEEMPNRAERKSIHHQLKKNDKENCSTHQ